VIVFYIVAHFLLTKITISASDSLDNKKLASFILTSRCLMSKIFPKFANIVVSAFIAYAMISQHAFADVYHEKIHDVQVITQTTITKGIDKESFKLKLTIDNEPVEFSLKYNESLLGSRALYANNSAFYKGQIIGNADSWARFNKLNGRITGAFFDGSEMYILEPVETVADSLSERAMADVNASFQNSDQASTVLIKASDLIHNGSCGLHDHSTVEAFGYKEYVNELQSLTQATARREIQINLIADTEFISGSADATADMMSHLNVVDGIFKEQLDIQFSLFDTVELSQNGSLTSSAPQDLLFALRNSNLTNPGLRHLFTGKNLDGSTVGIAFLGSLCRASSAGVTRQMQPTINNASCLVDVVVDLPAVITSTPSLQGTVDSAYQYDNDGRVDVADANNVIFSLDLSPSGMTIDEVGSISWIPTIDHVGTNPVQITASNPAGSDTQLFEIVVEEPQITINYLDFSSASISSYGGQDKTGGATVAANGSALVLNGNTWKSIPFDYEVGPETLLEFEFLSDFKAEIQGIAFDNDNHIKSLLFQ